MSKPSIRAAIERFLREEDGPTAVEYAVILALILVSIIGTVGLLADNTKENFNDSANAISGAFN